MKLADLLHAARRLVQAGPEGRAFAARAWLAAPVIQGSLTLLGLRTTLRWVEAIPAGKRRRGTPGVREGEALVRGAFKVHVVKGECLPRSLVQLLVHRRAGLPARLVVGVHRPALGERLEAHAWLEDPAEPTGAADPHFAPLLVVEPWERAA